MDGAHALVYYKYHFFVYIWPSGLSWTECNKVRNSWAVDRPTARTPQDNTWKCGFEHAIPMFELSKTATTGHGDAAVRWSAVVSSEMRWGSTDRCPLWPQPAQQGCDKLREGLVRHPTCATLLHTCAVRREEVGGNWPSCCTVTAFLAAPYLQIAIKVHL
jgi:hypothetical protein